MPASLTVDLDVHTLCIFDSPNLDNTNEIPTQPQISSTECIGIAHGFRKLALFRLSSKARPTPTRSNQLLPMAPF